MSSFLYNFSAKRTPTGAQVLEKQESVRTGKGFPCNSGLWMV